MLKLIKAGIRDGLMKVIRINRVLILSLFCFSTVMAGSEAQMNPGSPVVLGNEHIRVEAYITDGQLHERYLARGEGQWIPIATDAEDGTAGPIAVIEADQNVMPGKALRATTDGNELVEEFSVGEQQVVRKVRLCSQGQWVHVTTRLQPAPQVKFHAFVDRFKFSHQPDWCFAPSVGGFIPDAQYKAPLILVQSGRIAFGIVPDVAELDRKTLRQCNHTLDLNVPGGPTLTVGFVPAHMVYHSVYEPDRTRTWMADVPWENSYYMLITATAEPGAAYREAVRLHWRCFGHAGQLHAAEQQAGTKTPPSAYAWLKTMSPMEQQIETDKRFPTLALWDDWRKVVWDVQSRQKWLQVPLPGGEVGGGVLTNRWGPGPSVYLSAWFNTLRTSFGMALYARRTGNEELLRLARQTTELALKAPGADGAFKCIAVVPSDHNKAVLWAAGDGSGGSTKDGYLGYDMSWTAYWLLKWRAAELPGSDAILPRCRALADFFIKRQSPDGMLPTWFAEDGSVIEAQSRTVKAETGPVVLFLLELYAQDPNSQWLAAAKRGLTFLEQNVIAQRQWYDFETFWSCSPRKPALDERSQQWPANDLALGQTVAAYLTAFRVTGDRTYLDHGERLLDYLLLYQQCWTNPLINDLKCPTMLLGGFTTQNSDAEWSDARQSQFGNILLDYYRASGEIEYLERGIAALRAQFPVSPSENWAHEGYGTKSGISSFHWGTGSGMAGIEIEEDYLRDAVVDVASGQGVGVNGLNVTECTIQNGDIRLGFTSPFPWQRSPVFVFHRCKPLQQYRLYVNGTKRGVWRGEEMEKGIKLPLSGTK